MKKIRIIMLFTIVLTLIVNIILLVVFFPTMPIFGYKHSIPSGENQITITEQPLSNVLNDSYYSSTLKFWYITSLIFQIITIIILFIALIVLITKVIKKNNYVIMIISFIFSIINSITIFVLFINKMPLNIVSIIALLINITLFIIYLVSRLNSKEYLSNK